MKPKRALDNNHIQRQLDRLQGGACGRDGRNIGADLEAAIIFQDRELDRREQRIRNLTISLALSLLAFLLLLGEVLFKIFPES